MSRKGKLTMGMVQGALDVVDCSIGHAAPFEDLQPFLGGLLLRRGLDQAIDFSPMLYSIAVCRKASIRLPLRVSQPVRQYAKQLVIPASEKNVTIEGLVAPVGHDRSLFSLLAILHPLAKITIQSYLRCAVPHRPESFFPLIRAELARFDKVAT